METFYNGFESKVVEKEKQLQEIEERVRGKDREHTRLNSEKSAILIRHGKLQQEAERHKSDIKERDSLIVDQSKILQFKGFENPPFSQEKVTSFVDSTKERYQNLVQERSDSKQTFQERIDSIQEKIDGIKKTLYQYEETIRIKNNLCAENQKKLKQIGRDLSNVDVSQKKLQRIEKDLKTAEKELEDTKASGNVGQWRTELEESQKEKRRLESDLNRLRDEQHTMTLQSTTQAKLDMSRKQREAKEDAIQKILDRHEGELQIMFGACGPIDTVKTRVSKFLQEKRSELNNMDSNIQKLKQQQSSKQAEKRMIVDEIANLEKLMSDYKDKIKQACGEKEYSLLKNEVYDAIEQAKSKCSQLSAFETIYKKYISNMETKEKAESCCPLCHRQFGDLKEMQNLVDELKDKIRRVPEKVRSQKENLQRDEEIHDRLQKLTSVKDNLEDIENKKLPIAKQKLSNIMLELGKLQSKIEEMEDVRSVVESEEIAARQMEPDFIMLEEHQKSLKILDKEISLQQAKIEGVAPGRSMQLVNNEISDCQDRVDGLNRVIDRKRNQISQLESQISSSMANVHDLSSEKMRLSGELQQRTRLEQQKAELSAANMEHERDVKEAERQLQPINKSLKELEQQHKSLVLEQEAVVAKTNTKLNDIKGHATKLKDKMAEIRKYENDNRESVLKEVKGNLTTIEDQIKKISNERERFSTQMDELKDDLSRTKVRVRELQDNIQLLENAAKISNLERRIARVKREEEKLGNCDEVMRYIMYL